MSGSFGQQGSFADLLKAVQAQNAPQSLAGAPGAANPFAASAGVGAPAQQPGRKLTQQEQLTLMLQELLRTAFQGQPIPEAARQGFQGPDPGARPGGAETSWYR